VFVGSSSPGVNIKGGGQGALFVNSSAIRRLGRPQFARKLFCAGRWRRWW